MIVHAMLRCEIPTLSWGDDHLIDQIKLIADYDNRGACILHFVNALDPVANSFKRLLARLIKRYDDAVSLSIELIGDISELLLAGSIPDFYLNALLVFLVGVIEFNELNCYRL